MITIHKNVLMSEQTLEMIITMQKLLICGLTNVGNEINDVQKRTDDQQTLEMIITTHKITNSWINKR